jgi:hypothetical protein
LPTSRPGIEALETRNLLTATHLQLTLAAGPVTAGNMVNVTVSALDANDKPATDYLGTIQFQSSDPMAQLPGNYTFTSADNGTHTVQVQLQTAGTPTVLAADTGDGTITGSATVTVVPAPVDHFAIVVPSAATAGQPFAVTVTAQDKFGNTVTDYTGDVSFSSTDGQGQMPPHHTFVALDNGQFTASATFVSAGQQTLTVAGANNVQGGATVTVDPGPVMKFDLAVSTQNSHLGPTDTATITARDAQGNVATNYTGTVQMVLTDQNGAVLSAAQTHTFTAADAGQVTLSARPLTFGPATLIVFDAADPSVNASANLAAPPVTPTELYVNSLYETLLGRAADFPGLIHFASQIDQGGSRMAVAQQIEGSTEYHTLQVTSLYENLLGREPDPAGLSAYVGLMDAGMSPEDVAAALLNSDEYRATHNAASNTGYVTALYETILQREPDSGGLATYVGLLDHGGSRQAVALDLLHSTEAEAQLVAGAYETLLNRAPDPTGQKLYVTQMQHGLGTADLFAALLASDEFFQKATAPA